MKAEILVAGASGFLGRNLVKALGPTYDTVATYNTEKSFPQFLERENLKNVQCLQVDLSREPEVKSKLGGSRFDAIVNLAGNANLSRAQEASLEDLVSNVGPVINLGRFCRTDHFVHFSSGAVYDGHVGLVNRTIPLKPQFSYAVSKLASENYVASLHRHGAVRSYTIVRFFGAYGPYEPPRKIFSRLVRAFALEGESSFSITGDGRNLIDAMYVDDAVEGMKAILAHPAKNLIFDFGKGEPLSVNDLVFEAAKILGVNNVRIANQGAPVEYITFACSPQPFEEEFGFRARVSLEVGLLNFARWMKKG